MKIVAPNIYLKADNWACLISDQSVIDLPGEAGDTEDAVIYMTPDGVMHSTPRGRWIEEWNQMPYYDGEDEAVAQMIRRTNPGESPLDFISTFESWHESEMGITSSMLELTVAATAENLYRRLYGDSAIIEKTEVRIGTEDLQRVLQTYEIERVPEPHAFTFVITKSFPEEG